jgi:D-alanyl-D-alanine carboxypeptidase/D-alanyl-D-alanine-endopeptidase (penicillin-binding protein 4)
MRATSLRARTPRGYRQGMTRWRDGLRAGVLAALALAVGVARPAAALPPDAERALRDTLAEILRAPELDDVEVAVHVRGLGPGGRTIFAHNATKLVNPASNVKLVTSAAALWKLGPNFRWRTPLVTDKPVKNGVLEGSLFIKAQGDPTLTGESLFTLANELALRGLTEVKGDLVVDVSHFDAVVEGPGWDQERSDRAYAAVVGPAMVDYGAYTLRILPGDKVGAPARVMIWPDIPSIEVTSTAETGPAGSRTRLQLSTSRGDGGKVTAQLRGEVALDLPDGEVFYRRVYDPALYAGEAIRRVLELRGLKVKGRVKVASAPKFGTTTLYTHESKRLADALVVLNKLSNNQVAELILKTLGAERRGAPGTWQKGVDVVAEALAEMGIPHGSYVMANGSGLNDVNRFTAEQLTTVLAAIASRFELAPELMASLPVAGVDGTIQSRFGRTPAAERLRAKTGTLFGVSALSGLVPTRSGEVLAFSVVMNGFNGRARPMWRVQEQIGVALAELRGREGLAMPSEPRP